MFAATDSCFNLTEFQHYKEGMPLIFHPTLNRFHSPYLAFVLSVLCLYAFAKSPSFHFKWITFLEIKWASYEIPFYVKYMPLKSEFCVVNESNMWKGNTHSHCSPSLMCTNSLYMDWMWYTQFYTHKHVLSDFLRRTSQAISFTFAMCVRKPIRCVPAACV